MKKRGLVMIFFLFLLGCRPVVDLDSCVKECSVESCYDGCNDEYGPTQEKICAIIDDDRLRKNCLEPRENINDTKDMFNNAVKNKDLSLCSDLPDVNLKNSCSDNIYLAKAQEQKDPGLCEQIIDNDLKQDCMDNIYLELSWEDSIYCQRITDEEIKQNCQG